MVSKHTIVYAEDDMDDVFMVQQAFEQHDHIKVIHAPNGSEALLVLEEMLTDNKKPCLVILDINMPVLNGKETLLRIKNHDELNDIPVVLFTTSSSLHDKTFAEQWAAELIVKPLHYSDLESIARQFVDKCNFEINKLSPS